MVLSGKGWSRAALLDVNSGDGRTRVEIATELESPGVSFLFLTGHSPDTVDLPAGVATHRNLSKPFDDSFPCVLHELLRPEEAAT
ncbi:hypothetical protein [uncultured Jannaschia sp.]|uniref:hypothetical protein n=1 Tax=uncultured Jannaschia sp. TaxID=293347 RepID=UPI002626434B|nr:hypothetical protein [uncultured Jannaschia sp.]